MTAIREVLENFIPSSDCCGDNLGLRVNRLNYEIDTETETETKKNKSEHKNKMIDILSGFRMPESLKESYTYAFRQWEKLMASRTDCESFYISSSTGILLGMGNASVHEFGVSLNHPWGVPYISGSTLKGIVSSYLAEKGGDAWWKKTDGGIKSDFQVEIFGGVKEDDKKSYAGSIVFNDAWLAPSNDRSWFTGDIVTVHYPSYYGGNRMPDGTDNPVPVKIAALGKDLRFLVTLQGDDTERKFIKSVLLEALADRGIGGKTAVGYGRFASVMSQDEQNSDLKNKILKADKDELIQLANKHGRKSLVFNTFTKALESMPCEHETINLFERFSPLKFLWSECNAGRVQTMADLNKLYKRIKDNLTRFVEQNQDIRLPENGDAQNIFNYALKTFQLSTAQINGSGLLSRLAYGWQDVEITADTIEEIVETLPNRIWPPAEDLKEAIINASALSEEDKEIALIMLDETPHN